MSSSDISNVASHTPEQYSAGSSHVWGYNKAASSIIALEQIGVVKSKNRPRVHLEVDTGMTRGGFLGEWGTLDAHHVANIDIVGIFSHFARADEPGEKQNTDQSNVHVFKYTDDSDQWDLNNTVWETAWKQDREQAELINEVNFENLEIQKLHYRNYLKINGTT